MTCLRRRSIAARSARRALAGAAAWFGAASIGPALTGCTAFATVRSAEVRPGPAVTVQASYASPPGDDAAWFWAFDCAQQCDHAIPAVDVVVEYGRRRPGSVAYTLGFGVSGVHPYAEGYVQLGSSRRRPFGVGGRVGLPIQSWTEHQVYGRLDVPLTPGQRLLLNPGVFYHSGHSPNGANPGSFLGFVQGVGIELDMGTASIRPAAAVVWGRAERRSDGERFGPTTRVFGTASLAVSVHAARPVDGAR
jgi:hypothetical protein